VWQTVFDASYLVMGLGDVYLGYPLIRAIGWSPPNTTRREPGRRKTRWASAGRICASTAWKARAAISLSAAPCRCGSRYHEVADFAGKPWLLRFFDQLRFYPVSAEELLEIRRDFPLGRYPLRIEHSTLRLAVPAISRSRGAEH
jgi:urea carboxylase